MKIDSLCGKAVRVGILIFLFSFMAQAGCLDANLVASVREHVRIQPTRFDLCDETTDSHKLFSALIFLKSNPLPTLESPLSKSFLPTDAWGYFASRIHTVINESSCALGQMAFVRAFERGVLHLCPSFFAQDFSIIERIPTLLHEAHHFDGDNFAHEHCTQGRLKGMRNACDPSLEYGGGYAIEVEVLSRLNEIPHLSSQLRAKARNMALVRATENFNKAVTSYRLESIYLESAEGKGYLLDPLFSGLKEVPLIDRRSQDIVSRGTALTVFPRDGRDAYAIDTLSEDFQHLPAEGEVALNFNKLPAHQRPRILRIFNDDTFSGSVSDKRFSVALSPNSYETEVDLAFTAVSIFNSKELGAEDPSSLYLLDTLGNLNRLKLSPGRTHEIFPPLPFPGGFRQFVVFQDQRLAISDQGVLVRMENGTWTTVPAALDKKFVFVSHPFYWAPFLAP